LRKLFYTLVLLFLFVLGVGVAVLESRWGRQFALDFIISSLKKSGVSIEVGEVSGEFPKEISLTNVQIRNFANRNITVDSVHAKLSLLRLLKQELCISTLTANGVHFVKLEGTSVSASSNSFRLPFTLNVQSFSITQIDLPPTIELRGKLKIRKNSRSAFASVIATRPDFPGAKLEATGVKRGGQDFEWNAELESPTLAALKPWLEIDAEGPLAIRIYGNGTPDTFSGKFRGRFTPEKLSLPAPFDAIAIRDWVFRGRIEKAKNGSIQCKQIVASSRHLRLKGSIDLDEHNQFAKGRVQLQTDLDTLPFPLPIKGKVFATGQFSALPQGLGFSAHWQIPTLEVDSYTFHKIRGSAEGKMVDRTLFSQTAASFTFGPEEWTVQTPLTYRPGGSLILEEIQLESPLLKAGGNLVLRDDGIWVGSLESERLNLQVIQRLFPPIELYGQAGVQCSFEAFEDLQVIHAKSSATELYLGVAYAKSAALSLDWREDIKGNFHGELKEGRWEQLLLNSLTIDTASNDKNWPFTISAEGNLKEPFQGNLDGYWSYSKGLSILALEEGSGRLFNYPVQLEKSARLEWNATHLLCKDLDIAIGEAQFLLDIDAQPNETEAKLSMDQVPLDFLSLNPLDVAVAGRISLSATLHEKNRQMQGDLHAYIENVEVKIAGEADPLLAHGAFEGTFNRERLEVHGGIEVRDEPLLTLEAAVPIRFELWPFEATLLPHKEASGHLIMNGHIEDFLDFFNLGTHRLEGLCACDLALRNTLATPRLEGYLTLEDGLYENYYTGTQLTNIQAQFLADHSKVLLRTLTAQDMNGQGLLTASGEISLHNRFPYRFQADLEPLTIIQMDFVQTNAQGHLTLEGDLQSGWAKGDIHITQTELRIPDRIPRQLPNLVVVYKNAPKPIVPTAPHLYNPYPLHLDINVQAPEGVFIGGKGLSSEWKGNFNLGGTYTSLTAKGKLELVIGEFVFAGRSFKLTDGTVSLSGLNNEIPYLSIAGTMEEKGILITARLQGPINKPQLTFQSTPPLPLSGILSYLLFGQDLSEISGFQAIQLAASVASLAGEGPDILESTRKSLGVDRLRIITTPSASEEGGETIALQVGKYIAEGVIVTVSQGAEDSSTNISIEVDIKHGFIFQAETQQQQEQGKFTLKYNLNY
jgi:hypothetical protein